MSPLPSVAKGEAARDTGRELGCEGGSELLLERVPGAEGPGGLLPGAVGPAARPGARGPICLPLGPTIGEWLRDPGTEGPGGRAPGAATLGNRGLRGRGGDADEALCWP